MAAQDDELRKIIIVQHCQSEHHVNNMSGGWTDTPLTELGRKQARSVAKKVDTLIAGESFALLSSDLMRASQTAEAIAKQTGLTVELDSGLREINTGVAAGWCTSLVERSEGSTIPATTTHDPLIRRPWRVSGRGGVPGHLSGAASVRANKSCNYTW